MIDTKSTELRVVTSRDVAEAAGVSQSTVSRAFSDQSKLSLKTRNRVLSVAEKLGYHPNALARSLISARSGLIGIVKRQHNNVMFTELLSEITEQLQNTDYQVVYYEINEHQTIDEIVARIMQYRMDGIILLSTTLSSKITDSCKQMGIPVLQMQRYTSNVKTNLVLPDNQGGTAMITDHLLDEGYKHFAYISGELASSSNMDRQAGFIYSLEERGYGLPIIAPGDYTYQSGYEAMKRLVPVIQTPCGVLCANDQMALGAIDAIRETDLSIPEDVGIVGYDDNFMASWPPYELTSMRQPIKEMARRGVEILLNNIDDPTLEPVTVSYPFEIVKRRSTDRKKELC